jgi:hypothetical protein
MQRRLDAAREAFKKGPEAAARSVAYKQLRTGQITQSEYNVVQRAYDRAYKAQVGKTLQALQSAQQELNSYIARVRGSYGGQKPTQGGGGCASVKTPCSQRNEVLPLGFTRWLTPFQKPGLGCTRLWVIWKGSYAEVCRT